MELALTQDNITFRMCARRLNPQLHPQRQPEPRQGEREHDAVLTKRA
jgi:hypothetical protein